jgi:Cu/Zn superoxide dismutase
LTSLVYTPYTMSAVCVLVGSDGVGGTVTFNTVEGGTHVTGEVIGLTPGLHGFHIHQVSYPRLTFAPRPHTHKHNTGRRPLRVHGYTSLSCRVGTPVVE